MMRGSGLRGVGGVTLATARGLLKGSPVTVARVLRGYPPQPVRLKGEMGDTCICITG